MPDDVVGLDRCLPERRNDGFALVGSRRRRGRVNTGLLFPHEERAGRRSHAGAGRQRVDDVARLRRQDRAVLDQRIGA